MNRLRAFAVMYGTVAGILIIITSCVFTEIREDEFSVIRGVLELEDPLSPASFSKALEPLPPDPGQDIFVVAVGDDESMVEARVQKDGSFAIKVRRKISYTLGFYRIDDTGEKEFFAILAGGPSLPQDGWVTKGHRLY